MEEQKPNDIIRVEVTFRGNKRMIYDAHKGADFTVGEIVIAEVDKGSDIGQITLMGALAGKKKCEPHNHSIIRHASKEDLEKFEVVRNDERDAFFVGKEKIKAHGLDMTLTEVEKQFDDSKIMFYFLAEHRVDFRELVKDLASHFKTRIELRQIGVRDEARRYDGVGVCGRRLCCAGWLATFDQISTQMARIQHLSLNQSKLSGNCGRLKCCLKFEIPLYEEINACLPHQGDTMKTAKGEGKIIGISALKGQVKVLYADTGNTETIDIDKCQQILFPERSEPAIEPETKTAAPVAAEEIIDEPELEISLDDDSLTTDSADVESELFNDTETNEEK